MGLAFSSEILASIKKIPANLPCPDRRVSVAGKFSNHWEPSSFASSCAMRTPSLGFERERRDYPKPLDTLTGTFWLKIGKHS
jgi:hypothetical protein